MRILRSMLLAFLALPFSGCTIERTYGGDTLMSGRYLILNPDKSAKAGYYTDVVDENCASTGVWEEAGKNRRSIEINWDSDKATGDYPQCDWAVGRSTWIVEAKSISNEKSLMLEKQ